MIIVGSLIIFLGILAKAFKLTNLLKYFHAPTATIPKILAPITDIKAKARVVLKSAVAPRSNGTKIC